jgi:hypothetical protein
MKVESQAGQFLLSFERMEPGQGEVVITGKMGVWDAKTHVSLPEFFAILRMTLSLRMLGFLLKAFFSGAFFARASDQGGAP